MSVGVNHSRLAKMVYPNGRNLHYGYSSGLDDSISRLSFLADDDGMGGVGTHVEDLSYLGLGTVVKRAHDEPDVDLTYIKQGMESNGDAGDQYTGLDRFYRIVDQRWIDTGTGDPTDRFQYGYDRNGNRLYEKNLVDATFSEVYHADGASNGYDLLNQLTDFQRGELSDTNMDNVPDTVSSASRSQSWDFDALGNWDSVTTDADTKTRDHNAQNQITSIEDLTTPAFDDNGNMTGDEEGRILIYDAWNRLVEVQDDQEVTLVVYSHDALGRRVIEDDGDARDLYYSSQWQVLEERLEGDTDIQYVWSPVYIDAMVLRDRDTDDNGSLDERFYVQQDGNYNTTAIVDSSGDVQERYIEDAYGTVTFLDEDWSTLGSSAYAWVYLHQGGRFQLVTGLYHFRNRELSATLGRWLQPDPIGVASRDNNLHRSMSNSPKTLLDPFGLWVPRPRTQAECDAEYEADKFGCNYRYAWCMATVGNYTRCKAELDSCLLESWKVWMLCSASAPWPRPQPSRPLPARPGPWPEPGNCTAPKPGGCWPGFPARPPIPGGPPAGGWPYTPAPGPYHPFPTTPPVTPGGGGPIGGPGPIGGGGYPAPGPGWPVPTLPTPPAGWPKICAGGILIVGGTVLTVGGAGGTVILIADDGTGILIVDDICIPATVAVTITGCGFIGLGAALVYDGISDTVR